MRVLLWTPSNRIRIVLRNLFDPYIGLSGTTSLVLSAQAIYGTRSVFKRSLNLEFS